MLRLREIMTRDVLTLSPDTTLRDAMELFAARHISGAPVVDESRVIGVVSTSDLVDLANGISKVPTKEGPEDERAARESEPPAEDEAWVGAEGWVEGEEPPAAFFRSTWEELPGEEADRLDDVVGPEWAPLEAHTVREAMTEQVVSLPPDADVREAADLMRRAGVHRILVMEGRRLAGLVTALDVADAVAEHRITARQYVFGKTPRRDERDESDDTILP